MDGIGKKLQKKSQRPTPNGVDTPRIFFSALKKLAEELQYGLRNQIGLSNHRGRRLYQNLVPG